VFEKSDKVSRRKLSNGKGATTAARKRKQQQPQQQKQIQSMVSQPESNSDHPAKRQRAKAGGALAVALCMISTIYALAGGSPDAPTQTTTFDSGNCPPGFFLSSSSDSPPHVATECLPRADSSLCDSYTHQEDGGAENGGTELDCVNRCASMGTDACNAISYMANTRRCITFRGCKSTTTESIHLAGWATVWLEPAGQPAVQSMDMAGQGADGPSLREMQ
jgi:hypothetical protein